MSNCPERITTLFRDVGGVLLTDAWDRVARKKAALYFELDHDIMQDRHHIIAETFEPGKITLEEYLKRVVFFDKQEFTGTDFREFMFAQSAAHAEMLSLITEIKKVHSLKIVVVSNESRARNEHRIKKFSLNELADCFISSSFVRLRKPDTDIFKLALDISQAPAKQVVYFDDQIIFVRLAERFGINIIDHTDYESTRTKLASFGLGTINHSHDKTS